MSQLDIATLTILLQANAAQFETQMAQARSAAQREARNISREIKAQSAASRGELMLLGDMFGVRLPREIRKMISESKLMREVLVGALGVTAAVLLIEKLDLVVEKIKSGAQELGGFTKAMQDFDKANEKASRDAQTHPGTIAQGVKNLADINAQLQRVQTEAAKARAEMEGLNVQRNAATAASLPFGPLGMLAGMKDTVEQFMHVRDLDDESVRLEGQRKDLIEEMTKMTAQHAANMEQLNHSLATAGLQGVRKSAADIKYLGEQLKKAKDEGNRFKFDEVGKQIQIATKEMNGEAFRSGLERQKQVNQALAAWGKESAAAFALANPAQQLYLEHTEKLREIEADRLSLLEKASAVKDPSTGTSEQDVVNAAASKRALDENIKSASQLAEQYHAIEDSVQKITAELSKASAFPQLAFPDVSQFVTSGHGVLDVTAERIREITRDTKTLEQATIGYLQQAQNESQRYATDLAAVNAAYRAGLISVAQLNDLTKKLNPNFQRMQQLGQEAARTIVSGFANAVVAGGGVRDILAGILEDLARIILEAALNPLEKSLGGFFGNLLGSFTGGGVSVPGKAGGGSVSAGMPYIVGEHGPELMVPGASGSIVPNGALSKGDTYYIDARGADAGVEQRVMRAIDASRKQAVRESVVTIREQSLRST